MTAADLAASVATRFPQVSARASSDHPAFNAPAEALLDVLQYLRDEQGFDLLSDVSGIDWGVNEVPRFSVAYHLLSTRHFGVVRVVAPCSASEPPRIPSATALFPAADWHEREAYDMFGIRFEGHPDLRRILMWDEYPHFPLRKDFPLAGIDVPLPDEEVAKETGASVLPAPMAGGPFVAPADRKYVREREPRARDESWNERTPKPRK
jgi:NADH-quinone oxidoreductase subunit C